MVSVPRRLARSLLARRGMKVRHLGEGAWLVEKEGHQMALDELDEGGWLVQPKPRRLTATRVGADQLHTHVVTDPRIFPGRTKNFLLRIGDHLHDQHLHWVLDELGVNCILDVGANQGQFARGIRAHGYQGRIVSFEPVSHLVAKLRETSASDPEWRVMPYALGEEEGESQIHVSSGPGVTSSLLDASEFGRNNFKGLREQSHTETIQVRRLDSLLDEAVAGIEEPRVFLKMDTQGFDLPAMRGAGDRIKEVVGLQSEVSCVPIYDGMPRLPEQFTEYEAAGFELSGMYPVTMHNPTLRAIEFDMLMVRPEALG